MPPAARITDNHTCPKVDPPPHVGGPIIQGETTVLIGFQRTHPPGQKEWSVELGSPGQLYRNGWRPGSLQVGEQLTVVINPLRDGSAGGIYVSATAADGKPIGAPRAKAGGK